MTDLSILLPTFNGARYLNQQLRSIQDQTFARWQLLVCDDGSTDGTRELLRDAAARDDRIVLLPSTGNAGQRRRLRQMVHASDADLIAIADQDDVWAADKLDRLLAGLDGDLSFGSSWLIDERGEQLGRQLADYTYPRFVAGDRLTHLFRAMVSAHSLIARRSLLSDVTLSRALQFDWCMGLEAAFGAGLAYVPDARTFHRVHADNQNNGPLRDLPNWAPISRWQYLGTAPKLHALARREFVARLEHLMYSDHVSDDIRMRMGAVNALCLRSWYEGRATYASGQAALRQMLDILSPLAGSADDLAFAEVCLAWLCADNYHPSWFAARTRRRVIERRSLP